MGGKHRLKSRNRGSVPLNPLRRTRLFPTGKVFALGALVFGGSVAMWSNVAPADPAQQAWLTPVPQSALPVAAPELGQLPPLRRPVLTPAPVTVLPDVVEPRRVVEVAQRRPLVVEREPEPVRERVVEREPERRVERDRDGDKDRDRRWHRDRDESAG